eukprot:UN29380
MVEIIHYHGLLTHPIDVSTDTLTLTEENLENAMNKKTCNIPVAFVLVCHLWGRRSNINATIKFAKKYKLEIFEDCAECFHGPKKYLGNPHATISAFSFGTIKHCTAFGGSVIRVNNDKLRKKIRDVNNVYKDLSLLKVFFKVFSPMWLWGYLNVRALFPIGIWMCKVC